VALDWEVLPALPALLVLPDLRALEDRQALLVRLVGRVRPDRVVTSIRLR